MKEKRFFTISKKMVALCQIPMIVICAVITVFSIRSLRSSIESEIEKSLQIVATSVNETYTNLYEGDYRQSLDGKVKKGDTSISGNTTLIDGLQEKTGFEVSILYGNMRLITTVKREAGGRMNGVGIDKEVYSNLEEAQSVFLKNTQIDTGLFYAYYQPLINSDGSVIGAIEVAMDASTVKQTIQAQTVRLIVFSSILLMIAAILVTFLSRSMVASMQSIKKFLERLADGQLDDMPDSKLMKQNDEIGDIYAISVYLQQALRDIVNNIKLSADNLIDSANNLSGMAQNTQDTVSGVYDSVKNISEGAKNQAEGTADTNSNVVRIREQISSITAEVNALTEYAGQMYEAEKDSERILLELNVSSESTKESVTRAADQILVMNSSVEKINKAVAMIQNIADETDLLSLNASIEAARAGDAGKGFAVVAEEICKLADQSSQSAMEIEKMIGGIMGISRKMVDFMDEVKENMNQQQNKLEDTKIKYLAVSHGVENSLNNIGNIKDQIEVLGGFGNAIQFSVGELAEISEQNAVSADDTMLAARGMSETMNHLNLSSEKLLHLADKLQETLVIFKV